MTNEEDKPLYEPKPTSQFRKDVKLLKKRGYDLRLLEEVVDKLSYGIPLEVKHCDHSLKGKLAGNRGCHIAPDWVLVYKISDNKLYLYLMTTGTHSDVYKM
jgi:mRNA interferase YafQ